MKCQGVQWIKLPQDGGPALCVFVNTIMNLPGNWFDHLNE
jgi:hypothetical protein